MTTLKAIELILVTTGIITWVELAMYTLQTIINKLTLKTIKQ
jgi:hypothetical protein